MSECCCGIPGFVGNRCEHCGGFVIPVSGKCIDCETTGYTRVPVLGPAGALVFRDNVCRQCNGPFVPFATPVGAFDVDHDAGEDIEFVLGGKAEVEAEVIVVLDGVECYEATPPRPTSMIGYGRSTFDPHTWIPIIYGGAPPNFEEWCIKHKVVFNVEPDNDATIPSIRPPSLRTNNGDYHDDSDDDDYAVSEHIDAILARDHSALQFETF